MSTFYVLPPRPVLEKHLAEYVEPLFPGLNWAALGPSSLTLTEILVSAVLLHPDVFVVYHEELPEDETTALALAKWFGAAPCDEIIEIQPGQTPQQWTTKSWHVADAA
jgi:hypothetical protein